MAAYRHILPAVPDFDFSQRENPGSAGQLDPHKSSRHTRHGLLLLLPGDLLLSVSKLSLQVGDLLIMLLEGRQVLGTRHFERRKLVRKVFVLALIEDGEQLIVFLLGERVVLVIVTFGAPHGEPHPDLDGGVHTVLDGFHPEFLVVRAALRVGHRVAMKGRRQALIERWIREQIARQLLDRELVIRQIAVQRVDHPVAESPHVIAQWIAAVAA